MTPKIIECPRDAIQGIDKFIATKKKTAYINTLIRSGLFDTIDFGSFVSPKIIPQMADTAEVLSGIERDDSSARLLAIVANERGAEEACSFEAVHYLGYPFSVSETFQIRNTKATIAESLERVKRIQGLVQQADKELVLYISMGFGNPYGDPWSADVVIEWIDKLSTFGIGIFSLADTIGVAKVQTITYLLNYLVPAFPELEFGVHLHTKPEEWEPKLAAAAAAGCQRFDGAMLGYGGCPMAEDKLTGNMPTERLLEFFGLARKEELNVIREAFMEMIN